MPRQLHEFEVKVRLTDTDGSDLVAIAAIKGVPPAVLLRMYAREALMAEKRRIRNVINPERQGRAA